MSKLEKKIEDKKAVVGVLGLGYVGLPLVSSFASAGLKVVGLDTDQRKVKTLNAGRSIIKHIPHKQRRHDLRMTSRKLTAGMLSGYDVVLISTDHSAYDWIVKNSKLVVDTRNATRDVRIHRSKIVKA